MTRRSALLPSYLALGFAIVVTSGCDSRLLVGNNPDATGTAGASGAGGSSTSPVADAGTLFDAWIAFDSNGGASNGDIYVIRADGTGRRRLTTESSMEAQPSFSRDGTKLAFASDRDGGVLQIYVMDLATGLATRVTERAEGAHDPAFTIDGTRLGYRSGVFVFTAMLDGTDERQVTDGTTCCEGGPYGAPVFLGDGQSTIYDDYNAIYSIAAERSGERSSCPRRVSNRTPPCHPTGRPSFSSRPVSVITPREVSGRCRRRQPRTTAAPTGAASRSRGPTPPMHRGAPTTSSCGARSRAAPTARALFQAHSSLGMTAPFGR